MPTNKYRKPTTQVIQVFRGEELEQLVALALQTTFASDGIPISQRKAKRFLSTLPAPVLGGRVVVIIEQYPLNSMQAHGKIGNQVFQVVGKTGNQYWKPRVTPHNPRTAPQQHQRGKMTGVAPAWWALSNAQRAAWNRKAKNTPKTGYMLFSSHYLLTH